MYKEKIPDEIDLELSKTYFGNTPNEEDPEKDKNTQKKEQHSVKKSASRNRSNAKKRSRRSKRPRLSFVTLAIIGGVAFLAIYLFYKSIIAPEKTLIETPPAVSPIKQAYETQKTLYNFEKDDEGWEIPAWELDKPDHVARSLEVNNDLASNGTRSMKLYAEFTGETWTGALVEIQHYLNLEAYDAISADIYLPPEAPTGLRGKLILTVGEDWRFVEMARSFRLKPGEWTVVTADLTEGSTGWKRTKVDKAFKTDVRKVAIRIESNRSSYSGPIYIDNITLYSDKKQ